ncbi:uncharacterized protein LOC118517172 isoform X2 [Anopheles stephensi]|uniref:uncharacterized protein LOC118517172 isoform X2 n=1 Tax=Anopheles stephensi TaxID=30069 RepID=UPI001658BB60|nr:uncharacterized protein LOC118517172 isoform X2 [Anopheles stephensi]
MSVPNVPICRICLSNDELQVSLFNTLPVTICSQCIIRLEQFYEYYCKSETSQRILTNGTGNLGELQPARKTGHSEGGYHHNPTLPSAPETRAMSASVGSESVEEHGSITIGNQLDPILTQSPPIPRPAVTNEMQTRALASPAPTLSFLIHGSKDRGKRKLSERKMKKALTQSEYTKF